MFGIGGSEIIVILIVALIFLGPDKLPEAAKSISKGIRDIKKQTRVLQQSIDDDEVVGGAIRDLKSALRGEEASIRPKPFKPMKRPELPTAAAVAIADGVGDPAPPVDGLESSEPGELAAKPLVTLPLTAGEPGDIANETDAADDDASLAALIRPAEGTVAKGDETEQAPNDPGSGSGDSERKHG